MLSNTILRIEEEEAEVFNINISTRVLRLFYFETAADVGGPIGDHITISTGIHCNNH